MRRSKLINCFIRKAKLENTEEVYDLCCKVELSKDSQKAKKIGFLLNAYTSHPELKNYLKKLIEVSNYFYVSIISNHVVGFLIGSEKHNNKIIDEMTGSGKIYFDKKKLNNLGFKKGFIDNYAMLDKIAIDPKYRDKGLAKKLLEKFARDLKKSKIKYIFSEIIEKIYDGEKDLRIKNYASLMFHKKLGAVKIGESEFYFDKNTFLSSNGKFKDGIYLIEVDKLLI